MGLKVEAQGCWLGRTSGGGVSLRPSATAMASNTGASRTTQQQRLSASGATSGFRCRGRRAGSGFGPQLWFPLVFLPLTAVFAHFWACSRSHAMICGFSTVCSDATPMSQASCPWSIRFAFFSIRTSRMPMPAYMHAYGTFPVLCLGSAGSCTQVARFLCCLPRHYWRFHATVPTRLRGARIRQSALRRLRFGPFQRGRDHDMAVWVYDEEVRPDRPPPGRTLAAPQAVPPRSARVGTCGRAAQSCTQNFRPVPRTNWARRPLHAQSYNFPTSVLGVPTQQHQTGLQHPKHWCLVVWSGAVLHRTMVNQHAHPLLSRQKGASLTSKGHLRVKQTPHNHTARNPSEFHIKNYATSVLNQ